MLTRQRKHQNLRGIWESQDGNEKLNYKNYKKKQISYFFSILSKVKLNYLRYNYDKRNLHVLSHTYTLHHSVSRFSTATLFVLFMLASYLVFLTYQYISICFFVFFVHINKNL